MKQLANYTMALAFLLSTAYWGYSHLGYDLSGAEQERGHRNHSDSLPPVAANSRGHLVVGGQQGEKEGLEEKFHSVVKKSARPLSYSTVKASSYSPLLKKKLSIQELLTDVDFLDSEVDNVLYRLEELGIAAKAVRAGHPRTGERYEVSSTGEDGLKIEATYNLLEDGTQEFQSFRAEFSSPHKEEFVVASRKLLEGFSQNARLTKKTKNILRWEHENHLVSWARYDKDPEKGYTLRMATEFGQCDHGVMGQNAQEF